MRVWTWLGRHDPGYAALRRASRAAIIMPALFALGAVVIGNAQVATFAAFGSFSMLLLVDFNGTMRERINAQIGLAVAGGVLVCLGTLASTPVWAAAVAMAVVTFMVLFAGTVSSVLASASTSLLLAFILPVTLPGGIESVGPRLAGWGIASAAAVLAVALLWPAPVREPLRAEAAAACRAIAGRLRADVGFVLSDRDPVLAAEYDRAIAEADSAVTALHRRFLATPYRPTGLSTSTRTVVRLIDELIWLEAVVEQSAPYVRSPSFTPGPSHKVACRVKTAAANALEVGADLLLKIGGDPAELEAALATLADARTQVEANAMSRIPARRGSALPGSAGSDGTADFISSLDPSFRAQELSYAVSQVAGNIVLTAAAERRTWWERLLGRQPGNLVSTFAAAVQRASAQLQWNSVWLHNSIRGATALGLAVLLADVSGVQHSFWVVLGTLSVLRTNALSTGQNALRGVVGTAVGVVIGAALLLAIGSDTTVLWVLLPIAIFVAGVAPTVVSFAAGQAGFTVALVLLFNVTAPTGWTVGLFRIEDIALGCAVSLVVGLLFWPRGAAAALRQALADAYSAAVDYLTASVAFGLGRCDAAAEPHPEPVLPALRAAAASRRLDDTFRTYLAERGAKRVPLAQVTASVTGVAAMRLASDAVLDLWRGQAVLETEDRTHARHALNASTARLNDWYHQLGLRLAGREELPRPLPRDPAADGQLIEAVRDDLRDEAGGATPTAIRIIWTDDYLDVVRRLQSVIVGPADEVRPELPAAASLPST